MEHEVLRGCKEGARGFTRTVYSSVEKKKGVGGVEKRCRVFNREKKALKDGIGVHIRFDSQVAQKR